MTALNKQTLINLLIDSPLREPIKINLIDIVNNTADADLTKVYPTISKELEIFQKATDRRLKLAAETVKKLSENTPSQATPTPTSTQAQPTTPPTSPTPTEQPTTPAPAQDSNPGLKVPPLDLPPLPQPQANQPMTEKPTTPQVETPPNDSSTEPTPTSAPEAPKSGDTPLPPPPTLPSNNDTTSSASDADEAALKEIQKELDALKGDAGADATKPAGNQPPATE